MYAIIVNRCVVICFCLIFFYYFFFHFKSVCKKCCKKALSPDGKEKVLTCVDCSATDKDQKSPNGTSPPVNPKDRRKSMLAVNNDISCYTKMIFFVDNELNPFRLNPKMTVSGKVL